MPEFLSTLIGVIYCQIGDNFSKLIARVRQR
jgi:hypothetical protein